MSTTSTTVSHSQWSNRFTYILAATGAAVGLGNIWKFPYITGENGGGAFVLVYLLCIVAIGIPVMMAEVMLGKRGRKSPGNAVAVLIKEAKASKVWLLTGWLGVVAGFLILSFYAVIAGWAFAYVFKGAKGEFDNKTPEQIGVIFSSFISDPYQLMFWSALLLFITVVVVARGVQKGLEKAVTYVLPLMFVLLIFIAGYAAWYGDFNQALTFMFAPDFSKLTVAAVLEALGHSFFTLSLASGVMMMYGAYLPASTSILKTSIWIAIADTLVALIAGMAIFPIVFANGMEAGAGPGLIFQTLPIAFGKMPFGSVISTVFFIMLVFAAFTSAIALIESSVAWLVEKAGMRRWQAASISGLVLWLLGIGTIYSFTADSWAHFSVGDKSISFFDAVDYLTSNILLPLGGLFIAVFSAWVIDKQISQKELDLQGVKFKLWHKALSYLAPFAIITVFLKLIGIV